MQNMWSITDRRWRNAGFKVGDKVLVEAEILEVRENPESRYKVASASFEYDPKSTLMPRHIYTDKVYPIFEKTYKDGMAEAWETARRIMMFEKDGGLSLQESVEIFGADNFADVFKNFTAAEAAAKIKAWEDAKEIHVGDVVKITVGKYEGIVSKVEGEGCYVVFGDGSSRKFGKDYFIKTGRTIDIAGLLAEIGGAE